MLKMDNVEKHPTKDGYVGYDGAGYAWRIRHVGSTWYAHSVRHRYMPEMYASRLWMLAKQLKGVNNADK